MESFVYGSPTFREYLRDHPHERAETEFLQLVARPGITAMDIGANIGISTVVMGKEIGKEGTLYSFEPLPEYFRTLTANLSLNGLDNVKAQEVALTDQVGRVVIYRKELSSGIAFQQGAGSCKVASTTIDRFVADVGIESLDLINMDCEGSELLVLKGAEETLRNRSVMILCEIHHGFLSQLGQSVRDIVAYLEGLQFQVRSLSLDSLKMGYDFQECEYIFAHNLNDVYEDFWKSLSLPEAG